MTPRRLLFVDDDDTFRKVLTRELTAIGFDVQAFSDASGAMKALQSSRPDVALLDLRLPNMNGMELLQRLLEIDRDLPVVMLTGHGAVPDAVAAMRHGAYDFLTKPVQLDVLEQTLSRACERRDLREENRLLRRLAAQETDVSPEIVGDSQSTRELRDRMARFASSDASVLIQGEHGTGKELIARSIHLQSERKSRPFVVIHCGAIPEALIESELFGHEKGAFTGADRRRVGLLEAAHRGTVFLDEIGELPLAVQPVLLRALQFGEIRPVGSERTRIVDVRIVCATNRDLLGACEEGVFREDLYYRLATLILETVPLRHRREDIAPLARLFLERHNQRSGQELSFSDAALEKLSSHDWPGNVRELDNAVTRLAALCDGPSIEVGDVERHVLNRRRPGSSDELPSLDLGELEALAVSQALARHKGNKRAAAAELGVSVKTLYNMIARHGRT